MDPKDKKAIQEILVRQVLIQLWLDQPDLLDRKVILEVKAILVLRDQLELQEPILRLLVLLVLKVIPAHKDLKVELVRLELQDLLLFIQILQAHN